MVNVILNILILVKTTFQDYISLTDGATGCHNDQRTTDYLSTGCPCKMVSTLTFLINVVPRFFSQNLTAHIWLDSGRRDVILPPKDRKCYEEQSSCRHL